MVKESVEMLLMGMMRATTGFARSDFRDCTKEVECSIAIASTEAGHGLYCS